MTPKQILAYINTNIRRLNSQIALKADAGESVDLSNIYTKTEVNALIPAVPTQLSQLSEDTTHRVVTDIEKGIWNAKLSSETSHADVLVDGDIGVTVEPFGEVLYWNGADKTDNPTIVHKYIMVEDRCKTGTITFTSMKEKSEVIVILQRIDTGEVLTLSNDDYHFIINGVDTATIELHPITDDYKVFRLWFYPEISKVFVSNIYPEDIPTVSDVAYDATTWDGNTEVPTKNAVRDIIETLSPLPSIYTLANDVATSNNVNPVTITDVVFSYAANSTYQIDLFALVSPTAATTGCGFQFDLSSAVTRIALQFFHQLANTGTLSGGHSVADDASVGVSSGMPANGGVYPVHGTGILVTAANTGTAQLRFRSETTAVTTCKAGTKLVVRKIA